MIKRDKKCKNIIFEHRSAVNGSPFTRYGSAPGRIAESSIDRTSDENEELVNSSGYTPRDKVR